MIIKSHFTGIRWFIKSSQLSFLIVRMVLFAYVNHYNASEQWCHWFWHYAYLMARKLLFSFPLVPAESHAGTIQLKCDSSLLNQATDRQVGFLSFLNYYYLITGINLNDQTINFAPKKSHISRKKSAKIKQSSRISWTSRINWSQQVSRFLLLKLWFIIDWENLCLNTPVIRKILLSHSGDWLFSGHFCRNKNQKAVDGLKADNCLHVDTALKHFSPSAPFILCSIQKIILA